jgi:basic amino acid/polyamine antiporter, APA family
LRKKKLDKKLGIIHIFAIASGAMISSGLFVLPGLAHAQAGPGVVLSYLIAGILAAAGTLSIAELTTAMPKQAAIISSSPAASAPASALLRGY